jgi:hypothetical protein
MPAKSNKFDFTNRGSLGLKMGQIIGNALEKEADKILKDAAKQGQHNRHQSDMVGSAGTCEAYTHVTHLDIKAPSKELGDEGCLAMIAGLETALSNSTARVGLALEDLNLTNNNITTVALKRLAPVIALASPTLRSLNLSNNHIKVESVEEAQQWDDFLQSFADCIKLRKVDLSGNTHLGSKALEIFAKVHVASDHIPPVTMTNSDEALGATAKMGRRTSTDSGIGVQAFEKFPLLDETLRSGLRSVAFIVLNNVGLDDCGALWLSYVIEDHFFPIQLIDDSESTRGDNMTSGTSRDGIEWSANDISLSKDGLLVLRKASLLREQLLKDGDAYEDDFLNTTDGHADDADPPATHRRKSNNNDSTTDDEHERLLLRSARRKLQRAIMLSSGTRSVDLWQAALRVVTLSRMFLMRVGGQSASRGDRHGCREPFVYAVVATGSNRSKTLLNENMPTKREKSVSLRAKKTRYLLLGAAEQLFKRNEDVAQASISAVEPLQGLSKNPNGDNPDPEVLRNASVAQDFGQLDIHDQNAFVTYQRKRLQAARTGAATDTYRDEAHASHLPCALIKYLIRSALPAHEQAVLTAEQFDRAYKWGSDRASLQKELEWLKDHRSIQVMRLLESIDCMEYSRV